MSVKTLKEYTPELRMEIIQYAKDHSIRETTSKYKVSNQSIYTWRKKYKGTINSIVISGDAKVPISSEIVRLKEENRKLRRILIDQLLEKV